MHWHDGSSNDGVSGVRFVWPWALFALLVLPLTVGTYLWLRRRKRKYAVTYASLSLIREARPERSRWRRILPAALLLASMVSLVFALARPQAVVSVDRSQTSIILTLDVSRSMCSTDVAPNRLGAAQAAARRFVDEQPSGTRIGIVAFAGTSELLVPPTTDTQKLKDAINGLTTSNGTLIGNGLLTSIDALARVNSEIAPSTLKLSVADKRKQRFVSKYVPDIVVLLTDGAATGGVPPRDAAHQAADRRVRVYTIGFGTANPSSLVCTAQQLGADAGGPPFGGGGGFGPGGNFSGGFGGRPGHFLEIDQGTLRAVAKITGGTYSPRGERGQLVRVFQNLPKRVETQKEEHELTVYLVGLGAILAMGAMGLSLWWNRYP